jgi:type I restriction enzyme, S subunit
VRGAWPKKKLGELSSLSYGYTEKASFEPIGPKFLRITDIQNESVDWNTVPYCEIDDDDHVRHKLRSGDLVFARTGATTGKSYLISDPPDAVCASYLIRLRLRSSDILPKFLSYYFGTKSYWDIVSQGISGSAQGGFNASKLAEIEVPTPPLAIQQRIVAVLDEVFARLVMATANAEQNLKSSRELFDSYLNSIFGTRGNGWRETTLGAEIDLLVGFAFKSGQYTKSNTGLRLLRGDNVIQNALRWDDVKRWPASDVAKYESYKLEVGDIVLAMDRTWVKAGLKYAVIDEADVPCLLVQRVARLRCRDQFANRFLVHLIGSPKFTSYVLGIQTGLSVPHISGKQIADFSFWKPSFAEQQRVGATIDQLASNVVGLERIYRERLLGLTDLKESILEKAFSGNLISPSAAAREAAE